MIETNRTAISTWETFSLVPLSGVGPGFYAIRTLTGNYLTAVNSGGIGSAFEAIHSNATQIQDVGGVLLLLPPRELTGG